MNDILIIGGGAIGMLSALELQNSGCNVTLLEQHRTGQEASWAGGGILSPLYPWRQADAINRLAAVSRALYPDFLTNLAQETGLDPEFIPCGLLVCGLQDQQTAIDWAIAEGLTHQPVERAEIDQVEPGYQGAREHALWFPELAQVRNPRLVKTLRRAVELAGVTVLEQQQATRFALHAGKIQAVVTDQSVFQAQRYLVAAGAWSGHLLADLSPQAPQVAPVQGQMVLFDAKPGDVKTIVLDEDRYAIPRKDGKVVFGSTLEYREFDKQTTQEGLHELSELARRRFPKLAKARVEHHWAGLRPSSPAGVPYISRHPEIDNLFINAGHFRNGVILGLASSKLIADLMLERSPIVPAEAYDWLATREDSCA